MCFLPAECRLHGLELQKKEKKDRVYVHISLWVLFLAFIKYGEKAEKEKFSQVLPVLDLSTLNDVF